MAFIFAMSSVPGGAHEVLGYSFELNPKLGNFLHIPAYYVLALLWKVAFEVRKVPGRKGSVLAATYATLFGAADEVHQRFVPDRYMDIRDVLANLLGAVLAVLTWRYVRPLFFRKESAFEV